MKQWKQISEENHCFNFAGNSPQRTEKTDFPCISNMFCTAFFVVQEAVCNPGLGRCLRITLKAVIETMLQSEHAY
ncbi:hypothetical protein CSA37_06455 [Candidatus Fermentibacteria bacterium]|nr:MAG: hypothetical protein CSA37_06455 [Candidatus Fermentibacteria bacterium]